ncbi:helix-turn-helix domain-containing protein [Amycolatopsis dendrobii]|uniref:Helix-turn-helix domain-containing protein n=1 Tax=Amycolatopsis dendrobii TaxID=2760662 RepID=A0A7W3ZA04_9PSEU|nr:helix-turn-helix domain-containing protein [Amycolatopsis dendrobii]MBB1153956.1 helix-turn-helix domain-containing protein [Amycolatopsis dendrobii]
MSDWMTPHQVAAEYDRHPMTVYKALECGELHGHQKKRRGRWSVLRASVEAWMRGMDGETACGCRKHLRRVA